MSDDQTFDQILRSLDDTGNLVDLQTRTLAFAGEQKARADAAEARVRELESVAVRVSEYIETLESANADLAGAMGRVRELEEKLEDMQRDWEESLCNIENADLTRAHARITKLESLGAPPDDSPTSHYNTINRAREWWRASTGLTGEAANGRRLLGWVLETLYAMQLRHRQEIEALTAKLENRETP